MNATMSLNKHNDNNKNNNKEYMKTLSLLSILSIFIYAALGNNQIPYHGLMIAYTKPALAKDIMYIAKSMVYNAQFWNYPDVVEEEGHGPFKQGRYIKNFDVKSVEYYPEEVWSYLHYDTVSHNVSLGTSQPIAKYTFHFNWKITAFGIDVAVGKGIAVATPKMFKIGVKLPENGFEGFAESEFVFEIKSLTGVGVTKSIKQWIKSRLDNKVAKEISKGIESNKKFLTQYLFYPYFKTQRKYKDYTITYTNTPENSTELNGKIWVAFNTELKVDDQHVVKVDKPHFIQDATGLRDIGVYHSPELIVKALEMHSSLHKLDMEYDLTKFGYSGKVKDFLISMPELGTRYNPDAKVKVICKPQEFSTTPTLGMNFQQSCEFTAEKSVEPFLIANVTFKVPLTFTKTDDPNQLFIGKMGEPGIGKLVTRPQSPDIIIFIAQMFRTIGMALLNNQVISEPMLRYETLRDYYEFQVPQRLEYYVAFYDMLDPKQSIIKYLPSYYTRYYVHVNELILFTLVE
eukprot:TRINITY_DN776_c0_g1_i1.p2 TRINITY_DN776_c0_g1~~TRINITY_DN776_c0_g1_i1.p2  ORF type:complete len:515 (-),score=50.66 TRINITY_DN776_c0_g1_i1:2914-4458(-)